MRKSIVMAAAMTAGSTASFVGATTYTMPDPYLGADALVHVTQDSLNTLTSGLGANFLAAGSGPGQNLMSSSPFSNAPQETTPMSKQITGKSAGGNLGTGACSAFGGSNGAQSGTESRMSTLIVPLNGALMPAPAVT